MNEKVLKIILKLYVIIAQANKQIQLDLVKLFVESHLKKTISSKNLKKHMAFWDEYVTELNKDPKNKEEEHLISSAIDLCKNANKSLTAKQRSIIVLNILQLANNWQSEKMEAIINVIANEFKIPENEYLDVKYFIYNAIHKIAEKKNLLLVTQKTNFPLSGVNVLIKQNANVQFFILFIPSVNTYLFRYEGTEKLQYEGKVLFEKEVYILNIGTTVYSLNDETSVLYYSEVVSAFLRKNVSSEIEFTVNNIEYTYPKSSNGIKPFCFQANTGEFIGIMGSSGTGKSTLLDLFAGNRIPDKGEILLNGYNVTDEKNNLEGLIGYIPQDDLLNENLSVYQNLYFNAKLCFGNLTEDEIEQKVESTLKNLDLYNSRHLRVGSALDKVISGGQRKRLNIAFELIRRPSVLFVDEPTSGLSSADSEKVINQLKAETVRGSLVFVNIHQPSSNIFKQFDRIIIIDKEGYVIYIGNPVEAIGYFKKIALETDDIEGIHSNYEYIVPDKILDYVELKEIGEYGEALESRKIAPYKWYELFKKHFVESKCQKQELPQSLTSKPSFFKQFKIFFTRNLLSKLHDKQYVILGTLVAPLLALILSLITRHLHYSDNGVGSYIFYYNQNIPAFFLMSIIVALFVGLIISAEEIIHDKKIRRREKFLNLSQVSYINSKVVFLIFFSSFQSILYTIIGNSILELRGFIFPMWLTLFSLFFFGNIIGLIISSKLKSLVAIYIIIPIVLVPQILLSGVIVKFDKLHPLISSQVVVPVVGDLMASRWAYEALMVQQFTHNKYNINFFDIDQQISNAAFFANYTLPELLKNCYDLKDDIAQGRKMSESSIAIIENELIKIAYRNDLLLPEYVNDLNEQNLELAEAYIKKLKIAFYDLTKQLYEKRDSIAIAFIKSSGKDEVALIKQKYTNEYIEDFVLKRKDLNKMIIIDNEIINNSEPVYKYPESKIGRAQLFSSHKYIGDWGIQTFMFNILILWIFNLTLYIFLLSSTKSKK
jgi:ABC-type multidrug transport system ATPase subunit